MGVGRDDIVFGGICGYCFGAIQFIAVAINFRPQYHLCRCFWVDFSLNSWPPKLDFSGVIQVKRTSSEIAAAQWTFAAVFFAHVTTPTFGDTRIGIKG